MKLILHKLLGILSRDNKNSWKFSLINSKCASFKKEKWHVKAPKQCLKRKSFKLLFMALLFKRGTRFYFFNAVVILCATLNLTKKTDLCHFTSLQKFIYIYLRKLAKNTSTFPEKCQFHSRFICRFFAENAGSRGGNQSGTSSHSSLSVALHHGGYRLGGAKGGANGTSNKAISQHNSCIKEKIKIMNEYYFNA